MVFITIKNAFKLSGEDWNSHLIFLILSYVCKFAMAKADKTTALARISKSM